MPPNPKPPPMEYVLTEGDLRVIDYMCSGVEPENLARVVAIHETLLVQLRKDYDQARRYLSGYERLIQLRERCLELLARRVRVDAP